MIYRINIASQGGKPFAYHERPTRKQADELAARLAERHKGLTVTVEPA